MSYESSDLLGAITVALATCVLAWVALSLIEYLFKLIIKTLKQIKL